MQQNFWKKADNLRKLYDKGFKVPPFIALTEEDCWEILKKPSILEEKLGYLLCESYAVRSSSSGEDLSQSSRAGQYHTEINISRDLLVEAIRKCREYSRGNMWIGERLNIIIQKYIDAEISGICFTRDPGWNRESILEYHYGIGEKIVGGEVNPESYRWFRGEISKKLPLWLDIKIFLRIEEFFGCPQDIEWCINDKEMYILQSRPITTLDEKTWRWYHILENELPKWKFLLEKNEITEIAPNPTPFTFSLLEKIYASNWPIAKTYGKYGIRYKDTSHLILVVNNLYSNREFEIQSLFPAIWFRKNYSLWLISISGVFQSLRNFISFFLLWIRNPPIHELQKILESRLSQEINLNSSKEALEIFLDDYRHIFEVNLFAAFAIKNLQSILKDDIDLWWALSMQEGIESPQNFFPKLNLNLRGNSLEILDIGKFQSFSQKISSPPSYAKDWWLKQSKTQKMLLKKSISIAKSLSDLREYGRILMVRNMENIRICLEKEWYHINDVAYITIDELFSIPPKNEVIQFRKEKHQSNYNFIFPNTIASHYVTEQKKSYTPISIWISRGRLYKKEDIKKSVGGKILFTENLSPDLAQYFSEIHWIITLNWGTLSHLAILAREHHIPVVILEEFPNTLLGKYIEINGTSGSIEIINEELYRL